MLRRCENRLAFALDKWSDGTPAAMHDH